MKLTKTTKILLGFLSLWPIAYFFIFIFTIFSMFFTSTHVFLNSEANFLPVLFMLHFFTIIYSFGLVIFYICYIFKTDKVPKDKKNTLDSNYFSWQHGCYPNLLVFVYLERT